MQENDTDILRLLKDAKQLILSSDSGNVIKGLKLLKKIIKRDPENVWAFIYYGVGASKTENHSHEAVASFEAAANICPDSVEAWKGVRSCLEAKKRTDHETGTLLNSYINLLRLENDREKWGKLFSTINTSLDTFPCSQRALVVSSLLENYAAKSFKHKAGCEYLSRLALDNERLLATNPEDVLNAFQSWANFLDFADRPEFCKQVCAFMTKHKHFAAMSNFLQHTILIYGAKLYPKILIMQYVIDIASNCLYNVEKLVPLVEVSLRDIENVKTIPQIKIALSIINFFKEDFVNAREHLQQLSSKGDINASLFLLKFLCKAKDYDSVLFLSLRFSQRFDNLSDDKVKFEFTLCLMEALSCSNEISFLKHGLKLGLKALSKYGEDRNILFYLCQIYMGLCDAKAVYFIDKLSLRYNQDANYLVSVLKRETLDHSHDKGDFISSLLSSAYYDLIRGNVKQALKTFTKIGAKDKFLSDPFLVLGVNYLSRGDVERAAMCFHRAFSLRPLDSMILKHYLDSLFRLNDEEQALQVIYSVSTDEFSKWHYISEKALFATGLINSAKYDHDKSVKSFKHLLKMNPECLEFVEAISNEYIKLGRLGIAENYISRLVSDDPYDLHPLILLSQIYKLDVNYSSYFNQSIRCLTFKPDCHSDFERIVQLSLFFFLNFLNQIAKLDLHSLNYVSKICEKSLINLSHVASKGSLDRTPHNEYLIALYMFIESHYFAALKIMKCKGNEIKVTILFEFCLKAIGKVVELYGASHIAVWKLLGDILLTSSQLHVDFKIPSWILDENSKNGYVNSSSFERIHASIKCYVIGLKLVQPKYPKRIHEFYYDISVAFIALSNRPETVHSEIRHYCLKSSLESCFMSFKHSDGVSKNSWMHSNLLGIIVSLFGIKENMFKEHFSSREVNLTEGIMLQNYATHLAKCGLHNQAEETFEQARLRVDMDYASSWVGQLLMQLINKDIEIKKMLQYNLTQVGDHSIFKWILAYFLASNRSSIDVHGGQYSMLNYIFSESNCLHETNPSRIALMGYILELIGNIPAARRMYFRSLRFAKFVNEDTYNVLLGNAIRLNQHCKQNHELIGQLEWNFSPIALPSLFNVNLHHISFPTINSFVLFKSLFLMKNLLSLASKDVNPILLVFPLMCILTKINLSRYLNAKASFLLEFIRKNVAFSLRQRKREFRLLISSMDDSVRGIFLNNIKQILALNKFVTSHNDCPCLVPDSLISQFLTSCIGRIAMSDRQKDKVHSYSLSSLEDPKVKGKNGGIVGISKCDVTSSGKRYLSVSDNTDQTGPSDSSSSYTKVMNSLRKSVFPLPLSDEERMIMRRSKLLSLQMPKEQIKQKPFETSEESFTNLMQQHGCHSICNLLLSLLQKSVSDKNHKASLKFARLCLNIRCTSCLHLNKILPLISFVSVESNDLKLFQTAIHLYPNDPYLRKAIIFFRSRING